ncbi:MAG: hypothetical protein KDA25_04545, partial [Phycisphaerales bacterium]|nr:hypothetical protein [Phycisphaerales bacterium]
MPKRPMHAEDLWTVPRVGTAAPSPDGARLVVPVTTPSLDDNTTTTRLWLVPADAAGAGDGRRDDPARCLTPSGASSTNP